MMTHIKLPVTHSSGEYPIFVGENILSDKKFLQSLIKGTQVFIVTDENVAPHYLTTLTHAFEKFQCNTVILKPGEQHKTLSSFEKILDVCAVNQHHRDTTLIALGGGVISDITGFAAACYHRGVSCIHIPTTLLAQVDASIGGKTAVNHVMGKNLIGAFYPPIAVIIDIKTLSTLPDREFRAGLSEIIKAALIKDVTFFEWLEKNIAHVIARNHQALLFAIQKSCEIKRDIVMRDEKEKNKRALLNLGHTFGHAIEKTVGLGMWLHGEAVAYGIVIAATLSHQLGLLSEQDCYRIHTIITQQNLLKKLPKNIALTDLTNAMQNDKKVKSNRVRLILLAAIGKAIITDQVSIEKIIAAFTRIYIS